MEQPTFFTGPSPKTLEDTTLVLHALADFQSRGLVLAGRELPLDRLRGALRRAAKALEVEELSDERAAAAFRKLGAKVRVVPSFVAKHPFRVTVPEKLAKKARAVMGNAEARTQ